MKRKLLFLCLASVLWAWPSESQWKFIRHFPSTGFVGGSGCHGLAVDPEGKIWIQLFDATDTLDNGTTKIPTRQIFVFYPDGTPASFSGFSTILIDNGVDTLTGSGRGLRTDSDGNILIASGGILYRVSYLTGIGLGRIVPDSGNTLTAPAVSAAGNIYAASVVPGRPVRIYDRSFLFKRVAIDASLGFSRAFEVSRDGKTIYWAGYTNHAVYEHTTSDVSTSPFLCQDTVLKGFDAESFAWNPRTGLLWVSAGSYADPPNRYPGAQTSFAPGTWYAYNPATDTIVDSLMWIYGQAGNSNERPRALAFSPGGDTAYAAVYGNNSYPSVAMYVSPSTPVLTLESPNGEENWKIGSVKKVRWSSQSVATVTIELTTDGGSSWLVVAPAVPAASGSYSWTIPDAPSTTSMIRISATAIPSLADTSDQVFTISSTGFVAEVEPNGTASQAHYIEYGDSLEATLLYDTDVDYFKFKGNAGDTVYIVASERLNSQVEVRMALMTSSGQLLTLPAIVGGSPRRSRLVYTLTSSGLYYIRGSSYTVSGTFPNSVNSGGSTLESSGAREGAIGQPGEISQTNAYPYGEYTLQLHRFGALAPEARSAYAKNVFWNSLQFSTNVTPNGGPTRVIFEYGPTTSYGLSAPATKDSVMGTIFDVDVESGIITGFQAGQTYHERAVVSNSAGPVYTNDREFTMPAAPTSWFPQPRATLDHIEGQSFVDTEYGWAISEGGRTLHTTNGGTTWAIVQTPASEALTGICFVDRFRGWVSVGSVAMGGRIYTTADGGHTWSLQYSNSTIDNRGITFINPSMGWVWRNNGTFLRTTNGGSSWQQLSSGTGSTINRAVFIDANNGWATTGSSKIYHTTNGGSSWVSVTTGLSSGCTNIVFHNLQTGWANAMGEIARTTDGGLTWSSYGTGVYRGMSGLAFADSLNGWLCGVDGNILSTTDGGLTWTSEQSGTLNSLQSVTVKNLPSPVIVGSGGTILRKPYVHLQSPNGNEVWKAGSTQTIRWGAWAIGDVELWLSVDSGATWSSLGILPAGVSSKPIVVPNSPSRTCRVRITSAQNPAFVDLGDTTFAIVVTGPYTETEPNNAASLANSIAYGDTVYGSISPSNDADYFTFAASAGDTIEILAGERTSGQFYGRVVLHDSGGTILAQGYTDAGPPYSQHLIHVIAASGLCFIRYSSSSSSGSFPNAAVGPTGAEEESASWPPARAANRQENDTGDSGVGPARTLAASGDYSLILRKMVPVLPQVSQSWVNASVYHAVQFFGYVQPMGSPTKVFFEYCTADSVVSVVTANPATVDGLTASFQVVSPYLSSLIPDTVYSVRLKATNLAGTAYGLRTEFRSPTAPEGWVWQPSTVTEGLVSAAFLNPRRGIVVGSSSTVLSTSNGGAEWTKPLVGSSYSYLGSSYPSQSTAVVVGTGGIILRTTDAGNTWAQSIHAGGNTLLAVAFATPQTGAAVGTSGIIIRTTDGGVIWTPIASGTSATLTDVTFAGKGLGWIVGSSGTILHSTDSGLQWVPQAYGGQSMLRSVSFGDSLAGFAVGDYGTIVHTTDGGTSWNDVSHPFSSVSFANVWSFDSAHACIVGSDGVILRTPDGGRTLRRQGSGTTYGLNDVHFLNPVYGTIVGDNGFILRTALPGSKWSAMLSFADRCNTPGWLVFGQALQATDGRDSALGELLVSGTPPPEKFGCHFVLPATGGPASLTDFRSDTLTSVEWNMFIQPSACGYPVTVAWDSRELPAGVFTLSDGVTGTRVRVDMKSQQSCVITDTSVHTLKIVSVITPVTALNEEGEIPRVFSLDQNYPNPFNPSTVIRYGLPGSSEVRLSVYDMLGREVLVLLNDTREAGMHNVNFDASGLSSGVYFYRLQAGDFVQTRKLILLR